MKRNELTLLVEKWVKESIITREQGEHILSFEAQKREEARLLLRLLPLFVAILLGLSLLTFIASNWDGMPDEAKLAIIFCFVPAFYGTGAILYRKGRYSWGIAGIFLGVISFGVGMLLISDMFQYMSYDASLFFFWSLFATLFACLYRNVLLICTAALLTAIGQVYSVSSFETVHAGILLTSAIGFIYIVQKEKRWLYTLLFTLIMILQWCVMIPLSFHMPDFMGAQLIQCTVPFAVLGLMLITGERIRAYYTSPLKNAAPLTLYFYYVYNIIFSQSILADYVNPIVIVIHILLLLGLFTISYSWRARAGTRFSLYEWVLFIPVLFFQNETAAKWASLLLAVGFPIGLLLEGYKSVQEQKIVLGSRLLIVSIFAVYFQFGFTFMSKSLFFLIGALLVTVLYAILARKEKQVLNNREERKK
jgi:uncharacterized membrane protein